MRRFAALPALIAAGFVAVSGVFAPPVARATSIPHVFRFATAEEIATLNPELNQQLVVNWLSEMTAGYLFRLDAHNTLMPELATVVPTEQNGGISKDGLRITLHLRKGVKWSDGAPFDADDVAFSIDAMKNPANNVPDRNSLDMVTKIDEPNKFTVVVHLKSPIGAIVYGLFSSAGSATVLPKHILGSLANINEAPFNSLPVGIGPFRYKEWKRGEQIELEANPYYWRGRPALAQVIMKLIPDRNTVLLQLQTGEIDMWYPFGGSFLSRVQAIPNVTVLRHPSYVTNEMLFNTQDPVVKDLDVRRALRYAINRSELREKVGHGVGILQNVILPQVDPLVPRNIAFTPFDLAKANAILDAAGWKRGSDGIREKNGTRLTINVASSVGTPDADTQIELIRSTFKDVGAELNVNRYQSSILFGPYADGGILATGKFGVLFLGNDIEPPFDMENAFGCKSIPPAGQNDTRYCNAALQATIDVYQRTYDFETRKRLLSKILHAVDDAAIIIPTAGREDLFGFSNAVKNFTPNNATPFDNMMRVDVVP